MRLGRVGETVSINTLVRQEGGGGGGGGLGINIQGLLYQVDASSEQN